MRRLLQRQEIKIAGTVIAGYWFSLWGLPDLAALLAILVAVFTVAMVSIRLAVSLLPDKTPRVVEVEGEPFVSIHLPTYSEPPAVVIKTLESLNELDYEAFEVIVLDNNTPDPELYEPVRKHCEKLGSKFRFFHYDDVQGAKAGALNISLDLSHPETEYIVVLDADYACLPHLLKTGVKHFISEDVGLVQFPQAYRNSDESCGLTLEYKHFFDVYMNLANRAKTVLSTGTAAFIRKSALEASGRWCGHTLTEDAELGLSLHLEGFRVVYVPEVVAAGLMPTDAKSFKEQRRRWIVGNAQSVGTVLRSSELSWKQKGCMLLQLTAWTAPLTLPVFQLAMAGVVNSFTSHPSVDIAAASALFSIAFYLLGTALVFLIAGLRSGFGAIVSLKAFLAHLGTLTEASLSWGEIFVDDDFEFVRTDKFIQTSRKGALNLSLGLAVVASGLGFTVLNQPNLALIGLWMVATSAAVGQAYLRWNLHQIRDRTVALQQAERHVGGPMLENVVF